MLLQSYHQSYFVTGYIPFMLLWLFSIADCYEYNVLLNINPWNTIKAGTSTHFEPIAYDGVVVDLLLMLLMEYRDELYLYVIIWETYMYRYFCCGCPKGNIKSNKNISSTHRQACNAPCYGPTRVGPFSDISFEMSSDIVRDCYLLHCNKVV